MLEQKALLEISQTLAAGLELKPDLILNQLRMLTEYAHAALYELRDTTLVALAMNGTSQWDQTVPFEVALDDKPSVTPLITERQPYRIADIQSNEPAAQFIRALLSGHEGLLEGVRAFMWVPMRVQDRVMGAISMVHTKDGFFTSHHADLALIIANQAAITMFNAQLYEHAQTLAKLQERQRLGQELHDAVNQSLFSAGLIADVLPRLWELNPEEGRQSLSDLRLLMHGALAEMRGLLAELRPAIMTGTDFGDLIRQLSGALAGRINIPVETVIHGEGVLPADVQVTLYRLSQEALSNVAKHAEASRVEIQLEYSPENVVLRIADDGHGFDPANVMNGHSGLSMMHERAESIGVQLTVRSALGQGSTIEMRWSEIKKRKRAT
jgi:signal transduction histidine kinase